MQHVYTHENAAKRRSACASNSYWPVRFRLGISGRASAPKHGLNDKVVDCFIYQTTDELSVCVRIRDGGGGGMIEPERICANEHEHGPANSGLQRRANLFGSFKKLPVEHFLSE